MTTILENKLMALKILFIVSIVSAGIGYTILKKSNNEAPIAKIQKDIPSVLGAETEQKRESFTQTANNLLNTVIGEAEKLKATAKEEAEKIIDDTASKSADTAKTIIIQNTVGAVMQQIEKLPEKEQEEIKKNICN